MSRGVAEVSWCVNRTSTQINALTCLTILTRRLGIRGYAYIFPHTFLSFFHIIRSIAFDVLEPPTPG